MVVTCTEAVVCGILVGSVGGLFVHVVAVRTIKRESIIFNLATVTAPIFVGASMAIKIGNFLHE